MKLNVKKYQQGGIFSSLQLPNYLLYQPAPGMGAGYSQESSSGSSSKSKSKKDDDGDFKLLSQKVVDELITNIPAIIVNMLYFVASATNITGIIPSIISSNVE